MASDLAAKRWRLSSFNSKVMRSISIPLGIEESVLIGFFKPVIARQKPQPYPLVGRGFLTRQLQA
jgi:hypothetical protein